MQWSQLQDSGCGFGSGREAARANVRMYSAGVTSARLAASEICAFSSWETRTVMDVPERPRGVLGRPLLGFSFIGPVYRISPYLQPEVQPLLEHLEPTTGPRC